MKKSSAAKLIGMYFVDPTFPNAIWENRHPRKSIEINALRGSLSEIPIQIQIVPMAITDNNDLKNATESGVVPPSKASLPNATAKPSPREHMRAEKTPLNIYFSSPVIFLKYSKKKNP